MKKYLKLLLFSLIACCLLLSDSNIVYAKNVDNLNINVLNENSGESGDSTGEDSGTSGDESAVEEQIYDDLMKGGYAIEVRTDLTDTHLYSALLQIIKDYIKDTYNYSYTNSTLYSTMFKTFTTLNIGEMDIESLTGMEKFKFNSLQSLSITGNSLTTINKNLFENMPNLTTLNLACNDISSIDLSLATKLNNINLSSNNLTTFDCSFLTSQDIIINLANNNFSTITNISFPTRVNSIKLNLISNNITDITDEYFDFSKLTMNLGIQGLKSEEVTKLNTSQIIKYYKTNIENLQLKIYKISTLEDILVKTLLDSQVQGNYLEISELGIGDYYIEYQIADIPLYEKDNSEKDYFRTYKFSILPAPCVFKYEYKGKIYDTFENKVTGKVKVLLSCEEGAKILYSVNNGDWTEGNEVMCDQGGNYTISAKVVKDGTESEVKTVLIRTSLNTLIPDGLMLVLVLLFTLTLFFVVVPLVSKKWFR